MQSAHICNSFRFSIPSESVRTFAGYKSLSQQTNLQLFLKFILNFHACLSPSTLNTFGSHIRFFFKLHIIQNIPGIAASLLSVSQNFVTQIPFKYILSKCKRVYKFTKYRKNKPSYACG